jgi:hypothetical protein
LKAVNIGPKERRKRLVAGATMCAVGAGIAAALIVFHQDRSWRIFLFIPFWVGALGLFQARERT